MGLKLRIRMCNIQIRGYPMSLAVSAGISLAIFFLAVVVLIRLRVSLSDQAKVLIAAAASTVIFVILRLLG